MARIHLRLNISITKNDGDIDDKKNECEEHLSISGKRVFSLTSPPHIKTVCCWKEKVVRRESSERLRVHLVTRDNNYSPGLRFINNLLQFSNNQRNAVTL